MDNFIEPYGLVLDKNTGTDMFYPHYVELPVGVNTVQVTVPGTHDTLFSVAQGVTWVDVVEHNTIPEGTKDFVHTVGVRAGEPRYFVLSSYPGMDVRMRATVTVVNIPLYEAGA